MKLPRKLVVTLGIVGLVALGGAVPVALAAAAGDSCTAASDGGADCNVHINKALLPKQTVTTAKGTKTVTETPAPVTVTKTETVTASPSSEPTSDDPTTDPPSSDPTTPSSDPSTSSPADPPPASGECASSVKNDADGPDPWGGCWPGPSSTGASGTLTASGSLDITTDNTVIQDLKVSGYISVEATGVTIKNTEVDGSVDVSGFAKAGASLTMSHVAVICGAGRNSTGIEVDSDATHAATLAVDHANITNCENGFDADRNTTVTDSYIHDLCQENNPACLGAHTDGIQSTYGVNVDLEHNVWYADTTSGSYPGGGTSAINVNNNPNVTGSKDSLIQHNLVAGGAYTVYCPITATSNYQVVNNVFSHKFSSNVGEYGPSSDCDGEIWTGNQYVHPGSDPDGTVPKE